MVIYFIKTLFNCLERTIKLKRIIVIFVLFLTLSACGQATESYTISFQGQELNLQPITINEGEIVSNLPTPMKDFHLFDGWYLDANLNELMELPLTIEKDYTLYGRFVNIDTLAYKFGNEAFKEIFENTRGTVSIINVDWICFYAYASDNPLPTNKEIEEGIIFELCYYFITYERTTDSSELNALVSIFNGLFINPDFDTEEFFEVESEFGLSSIELDISYSEILSEIRNEYDIDELKDEFIYVESDLLTGSFSLIEIKELTRISN
jgi:hypothetical protein